MTLSFSSCKYIAASCLVFLAISMPVWTYAVSFTSGLVICEGALTPAEISSGMKKCDFNALIEEVQFLIDWMIGIGGIIATGVFAYAGILFMSHNEKNISKAKGMFEKVVIGFVIMLSAWLVVHTILTALVKPDQGYTSLLEGN